MLFPIIVGLDSCHLMSGLEEKRRQTFGDKTSRERPFAAPSLPLRCAQGFVSLRVTLLEWRLGCHPERSEGSLRSSSQTLPLRGVYPGAKRRAQGCGSPRVTHQYDRSWLVKLTSGQWPSMPSPGRSIGGAPINCASTGYDRS